MGLLIPGSWVRAPRWAVRFHISLISPDSSSPGIHPIFHGHRLRCLKPKSALPQPVGDHFCPPSPPAADLDAPSLERLERAVSPLPSAVAEPRCSSVSALSEPCRCRYPLCISWYPCSLKYCKGGMLTVRRLATAAASAPAGGVTCSTTA